MDNKIHGHNVGQFGDNNYISLVFWLFKLEIPARLVWWIEN